jgi:hypothetical protein
VLQNNNNKFNLDHIIVSTYGLFVVETKTRRKPAKGETKIDFDGNNVKLTGHPTDSSPIEQARANIQRLREKLPSEIVGNDLVSQAL